MQIKSANVKREKKETRSTTSNPNTFASYAKIEVNIITILISK